MLKRMLSVLLLAALVCSFAACGGETGEPVSSNIPADSVSADTDALYESKNGDEGDTDDKKVYVTPPVYENSGFTAAYEYKSYEKADSYLTSELKDLLEEHAGKEVWYTVFVDVYKSKLTAGDPSEEVDEAFYDKAIDFAASAGATNIRSATGASDRAIDSHHCYYMDVKEETLYAMLKHGNYSIALARPRTGDYNDSVTDYLTRLLENAEDGATFDVWVLTEADTYIAESFEGKAVSTVTSTYMSVMQSCYYYMNKDSIATPITHPDKRLNLSNIAEWGEDADFACSLAYARLGSIAGLGYSYCGGERLSLDGVALNPDILLGTEELKTLSLVGEKKESSYGFLEQVGEYMDAYMEDIISRAGIGAKISHSDYIDIAAASANEEYILPNGAPLPARRLSRYVVSHFPAMNELRGTLRWSIIPSFEAKSLTKEEIIKLSEDERIRAIYSTASEGATLTLLPVSGYTPWV
ncbi:MAG: hypothetical protein IKK83_02535 [Clostridia bacterium]|nr:hypothetical protein [Clostridia bacterium]